MTANSPGAIAATLSTLLDADTPRAEELLAIALDIPREGLQQAVAEALLRRNSAHGRMLVFEKLIHLPPAVSLFVRRSGALLSTTFRQMLLQGSPETRALGLRTVRTTRLYSQMGNVLQVLRRPDFDSVDDAAETVRQLVNTLYDRWQHEERVPSERLPQTDADRQYVLTELQRAIDDWKKLTDPELVIESVLALSEPQHAVLKQVLWHGSEPCRELACQLLMESRHPGVLRLMADSLNDPYPHPKVFAAIRTRHDPEFLSALLLGIARRRSTRIQQHLHQIHQLDWLVAPYDVINAVPPDLQPAFMAFINATRIARELKSGVQEWLLRFGTSEGKSAATSGLTLLDTSLVQEVVLESLESDDDSVQAWATSQLREFALPGAFSRLVERLDSPSERVQEAARQELADFSVPRVLSMADALGPEEARRAGVLLMKVDPEAPVKLRRELAHPAQRKRLDAARRAAHLGLHTQFQSAYLALAADSDPLVRRTAASVLATIPSMEAFRQLTQMQQDPHPRVRETAQEALQRWNRQTNGGPDEAVNLSTAGHRAEVEW